MDRSPLFTALTLLAVVAPIAAQTKAETTKAVGHIELTEPNCSTNEPGNREHSRFNIVKLSFGSDGKRLTVAATLKEPPGDVANDVLNLYFDTDNNPATGATDGFPPRKGFEFKSDLAACVSYADNSSACNGGSRAKATGHYAEINLEHYKGADQSDRETVVDLLGMGGKKKAPQVPVAGKVVEAALGYDDLKVKPGQTIRIVVARTCGFMAADNGFYPDILLTLK